MAVTCDGCGRCGPCSLPSRSWCWWAGRSSLDWGALTLRAPAAFAVGAGRCHDGDTSKDEGGKELRGSRRERILKMLSVEPGTPAGLAKRDPAWKGGDEYAELSEKKLKGAAREILQKGVKELSVAQELLWASDTYALLVVFQALDAAGKDSTIEHVMSGVNPQGVHVVSFRKPSSEELDHDFLWRIARAQPEAARRHMLDRSHHAHV